MQPIRKKGFEMEHDASRHILTLRLRGLWDLTMARQFEQEFRKTVQEIGAQEKEWYLLLDFTRCVPQPEEVQRIVGNAMAAAKEQGMRNKAILAKGTIVGFYPASFRGKSDVQVNFYFQSEVDAVRWLVNEPA